VHDGEPESWAMYVKRALLLRYCCACHDYAPADVLPLHLHYCCSCLCYCCCDDDDDDDDDD